MAMDRLDIQRYRERLFHFLDDLLRDTRSEQVEISDHVFLISEMRAILSDIEESDAEDAERREKT